MARKCDRRRPLTSELLTLCLFIFYLILAPSWILAGEPGEAIYFVGGTITSGGYIHTYPVDLYRVGDQQKLALVRHLQSSEQGLIDFAEDLHGRIYLVSTVSNDGAHIAIVHENEPERVDSISLKDFADAACWGAVGGDQVPIGVQYCPLDKVVRVVEVLGDAEPAKRRIVPGNWALFKNLQYNGIIGGPFQMIAPGFRIVHGNLVLLLGGPLKPSVILDRLAPGLDAKSMEGRTGGVFASTDRFFVFMITPIEFQNSQGITNENPGHAGPLRVYIHDKLGEKWRTLDLPTTATMLVNVPVRLFEPWLVTTVAEWRPGPDESPGHDLERKWSDARFPDVNGGYGTLFTSLFLPGRLLLDNLLDGRRITLETGQEDSEVLAIKGDGRILYRANDSIYLAKIDGTQINPPTLIVKDTDVPEVHWAFWGPPAMRETPSKNSRNPN